MGTGPGEIQPLSTLLLEELSEDETVTLGELTDRMARRGFGLFMIMLALPTLIPILPPGTAAGIGLLYVLLSIQMLIGMEEPWLPRRVRLYRLSPRAIASLRTRGVPFLRRVERLSRPRALLVDERLVTRGVALVVLLLGVVLFTPIPFLNTLPGLAVLLLGIGLLNRDGIFLAVGLLLTTLVLLVIAFGAGTLFTLFKHLFGR